MSEFWLWFWRPIADFLGTIAFLGIIAVVVAAFIFGYVMYQEFLRWWRS